MILEGRVWKFGDDVRSNVLLSARHDQLGRAGRFAELVVHLNEEQEPGWADKLRRGDLIVAGRGFGTGKHLEGLIGALKLAGIAAVIAKSFYAGWERDSINAGLPSLVCPEVVDGVQPGDVLRLDLAAGRAWNVSREQPIAMCPVATELLELLQLGGIEAWTLRRLGRAATDERSTHV